MNSTNDNKLFAFICTSDYVHTANKDIHMYKETHAIINSGASDHFSPDCKQFINFMPLKIPQLREQMDEP